MTKWSVYLGSTLDLLEVYNAVRAYLEENNCILVSQHAASLEQRLKVEDIESNIKRADAAIFLINGTDVNSQFVDFDDWKFDPVEAEWETGTRLTARMHAFLPSGSWEQCILEDARFKGSMQYRLRDKAEASGKCILCDSPAGVPSLALDWLESEEG